MAAEDKQIKDLSITTTNYAFFGSANKSHFDTTFFFIAKSIGI